MTLALRERGGLSQTVGEVLGRALSPHPSSDLTGTCSQGEGFPSLFETVDSATSGMNALRAE